MSVDRPPIRVPRTVATSMLVVLVAAAVAAVVWNLVAVGPGTQSWIFNNGVDTKVYRGGAKAVLEGRSLYDGPVYKVWQFTYAPFAAVVMVPLGTISIAHAVGVMGAINALCLVLLVALTLRALGYRRDGRFVVATVAASIALTVIEPVRTTIWNGQINLILAVLIVACLTLPVGKWRGVGVGLAAGIKLTPIFFVCYFAVTRQWRALATAVITFGVTVLIGLAVLRGQAWHFWTVTIRDTTRIGPIEWIPNQSFNGFFHRLGAMGWWHAPTWLWLPIGVVMALVALYAVRQAYLAGATMLAITLTGMTACAVAPFSWGHHWVWVAPLLLITLAEASTAARRDSPLTWLWWLAPAAIALFTFAFRFKRVENGHRVWRFGAFRWFEEWDPHGLSGLGAVVASGAYPIVFLVTVAATLWWTARRNPIRLPA